MKSTAARSEHDFRDLDTLLSSAADEMASLSEMSHGLHDLVARQMASGHAHDQSIEEAQAIDLLVQHLDTIGAFLRLLANETPPGVAIDFARLRNQLPLAGLAGRLGGDTAAEDAACGELDLF